MPIAVPTRTSQSRFLTDKLKNKKPFALMLCLLSFCCIEQLLAAEIYRCVGPNGTKQFSNRPCPNSALSSESDSHKLWHDLNDLTKRAYQINEALTGDIYSIKRCHRDVDALLVDINKRNEDIKELDSNMMLFKLAYKELKECADCRVGARQFCVKASEQLERAKNQIMFDR